MAEEVENTQKPRYITCIECGREIDEILMDNHRIEHESDRVLEELFTWYDGHENKYRSLWKETEGRIIREIFVRILMIEKRLDEIQSELGDISSEVCHE